MPRFPLAVNSRRRAERWVRGDGSRSRVAAGVRAWEGALGGQPFPSPVWRCLLPKAAAI